MVEHSSPSHNSLDVAGGPDEHKDGQPRSQPVLPLCPFAPPRPPQPSDAVPPLLEGAGSDPAGGRTWCWLPSRRQTSSCVASCLFHALLIIVLAMIVEASGPGSTDGDLTVYTSLPLPLESAFDEEQWEVNLPKWGAVGDTTVQPDHQSDPAQIIVLDRRTMGPNESLPVQAGHDPASPTDRHQAADAVVGGGVEGRSPAARARLAGVRGGNRRSEEAVERGLNWLVAHQLQDGSWDFNHHKSFCKGLCDDPGTETSTTGATAIALLAFLGGGYTHLDGEHQQVVRRGLYYLGNRARLTPQGADLQEGTMYAQGLATLALCEAYAMTDDPGLRSLAQRALDFIDYAQEKQGGGWRYSPGEPGDTTVTGWQFMALKSGQMAKLRVASPSLLLAGRFLDSVQCEGGARYGYMGTDPRETTTAIGLLCRMYTGWRRSHPGLRRGVAYLSRWGPSEDDVYYNYYATQVMYHWGGSDWVRWNTKLRDHLIATQATVGHEAGSWHFRDRRADRGGRLYTTAMAVMTLEVYYRYMPLYGEEAFDAGD